VLAAAAGASTCTARVRVVRRIRMPRHALLLAWSGCPASASACADSLCNWSSRLASRKQPRKMGV
jgi:hypothetical protein